MTKQELKKLIKEVINEAEFDDMQINSSDDLDYSDAKPGQVVTIQDMELYIKYGKIFIKMFKFIVPSDFAEFLLGMERDVAKIKQLASTKPFNKHAYLDAISRFKTKYGKILKP